jgi:hypothetical protein
VARETCVWEVNDFYQKQTFRNRTHICTDQGLQMLSIPIKHVGGKQGKQYYRDVHVDNQYPWQRQHLRSLQTAYRSSPFFEYYEDELVPLYSEEFTHLLDFNFRTIELVCGLLQIEFPQPRSSAYVPVPLDKKDMRFLVNAKIPVPFSPPPYTQVFTERHGFISNLSILDLLFNEGPNATAYLNALPLPFFHA